MLPPEASCFCNTVICLFVHERQHLPCKHHNWILDSQHSVLHVGHVGIGQSDDAAELASASAEVTQLVDLLGSRHAALAANLEVGLDGNMSAMVSTATTGGLLYRSLARLASFSVSYQQ